jgi:ribosomal protein L13
MMRDPTEFVEQAVERCLPRIRRDLAQAGERLRAFEDRYNATAQPSQWRFTTSDLHDLLARLDRHTADHQGESSVALAG